MLHTAPRTTSHASSNGPAYDRPYVQVCFFEKPSQATSEVEQSSVPLQKLGRYLDCRAKCFNPTKLHD